MATRQSPAPDLAPEPPQRLTSEQRIALWVDLMDACEQLLLAGFRRGLPTEDDVLAEYRRWYAERMAEHERAHRLLAEGFARHGVAHAR